jgi:hypothetical protein
MAKKKSKKQQSGDNGALVATLVAGGLGLLVGLFALGRRARGGAGTGVGAIDRALGMPSGAAADGGSTAADLGLDQPHHGPGDRAPVDYRPDPTAGIDERKRDAFAPATLPNPANPNTAEPAM